MLNLEEEPVTSEGAGVLVMVVMATEGQTQETAGVMMSQEQGTLAKSGRWRCKCVFCSSRPGASAPSNMSEVQTGKNYICLLRATWQPAKHGWI